MATLNLGKVRTTFGGEWDETKEYDLLTIVNNSYGVKYISKQNVPAGIQLSNDAYWEPLSGSFVEQYQGDKTTDPTVRNDGTALQVGDLYFNTTDNDMRVWQGTYWKSTADTYTKTEADERFVNETDIEMAIGNINCPLLDLPLKNSLAMKQGVGEVTFTRASTATYIDRYGVLKYAANDEPRFEKEGLLIEGNSTNLLLYSEQFDNSAWAKTSGLTVTANTTDTTAPDGSNNADIIEDTDDDVVQYIYQYVSIDDDDKSRTFSVFLKAGTSNIAKIILLYDGGTSKNGSLYINLENGELSPSNTLIPDDYNIKYINNGWYRVSVTLSNNSSGNTIAKCYIIPSPNADFSLVDNASATGSIYVWGAQLEELPFASSYIPTTDTAVTRAADNCIASTYNNVSKPSNGLTFILDYSILGKTGGTQLALQIGNGSAYIGIYGLGSWGITNKYNTYIVGSNINYRIAVTSDQKMFLNGEYYNSTNGDLNYYDGYSGNIYIGSNVVNFNQLYGHISNFRIYDRALTDEEVRLA